VDDFTLARSRDHHGLAAAGAMTSNGPHRHHPSRPRGDLRDPALGSVGYENQINERGERLVWLAPNVVNRLRAMRGPGESYSDGNGQELSRIAQLDQRTALPDQCLHSAETDVRPPRRKAEFDPLLTPVPLPLRPLLRG
jgi:hypothetical protein